MDALVALLAQHGTTILCAAVFLETVGFPIPAAMTAIIDGGLRGWRKAGLPVEPVPADEVTALPVFERPGR